MLKRFKKFKRLILTSTLKTKAFLILFALFFSSLAFAATLTVTLTDGRIPIHDTRIGGVAKCKNSAGEFNMDKDSTEDPYDVALAQMDYKYLQQTNYKRKIVSKVIFL